MFNITQSNTYTWPVTAGTPQDGGKTEKATFDAEFKRLTQTRVEEIRRGVDAGEIRDIDLAREVLVGWAGVAAGGTDLPFSESARDRLLDMPGLASAVVTALLASLTGAKLKN